MLIIKYNLWLYSLILLELLILIIVMYTVSINLNLLMEYLTKFALLMLIILKLLRAISILTSLRSKIFIN